MLVWENDPVDAYRAEVQRGTYIVSDADSMGMREVKFMMGDAEYYVGNYFGSDSAKDAAEKHSEWLSAIA